MSIIVFNLLYTIFMTSIQNFLLVSASSASDNAVDQASAVQQIADGIPTIAAASGRISHHQVHYPSNEQANGVRRRASTLPAVAPGTPDPSTEQVHCYDSGAGVTRKNMIRSIEDFCRIYEGMEANAAGPLGQRMFHNSWPAECTFAGCFDIIYVSVTAINGCKWTMDGARPEQECGRILRRVVDECDRGGVWFKQGGAVRSNCAEWIIDPELNL